MAKYYTITYNSDKHIKAYYTYHSNASDLSDFTLIGYEGNVDIKSGYVIYMRLYPDDGYDISSVTVNGQDITNDIYSYEKYDDYAKVTLDGVWSDIEINTSAKIPSIITSPLIYESSSNTLPSNNNFTMEKQGGSEEILNGVLHCSSGRNYIGYIPYGSANGNSRFEVKFSINTMGTNYGFRVQLSDGTKGVQVGVANNYLYVTNGTTKTNYTQIKTGTIYTLGIEYNSNSSIGYVYLNYELIYIYTGNFSTYYATRDAVFVQSGTDVYIYNIKYWWDNYNPLIFIQTQDITKISSINGKDRCTVSFISEQGLSYWEARATLPNVTPSHGVGLLVESGTLSEGETGYVYVDDEELTNGDANYTITIYGQNSEGVWSDE